jgi:hypothetical protein
VRNLHQVAAARCFYVRGGNPPHSCWQIPQNEMEVPHIVLESSTASLQLARG